MPPNVDDLTDEEKFDDNLGTPVVSDVIATVEATIPDDNIILDKIIPINVNVFGNLPPPF